MGDILSTCTWNCVEVIFKKMRLHYLIVSLILAGALLLIFISFSYFVSTFELKQGDGWDIFYILELSTMSVLVGYEMAGIHYLLNESRKAFSGIESGNKNHFEFDNTPYNVLENRLTKSHLYYAFTLLVIMPLLIIDIY